MDRKINDTQIHDSQKCSTNNSSRLDCLLQEVVAAMKTRGYDPTKQLYGYFLSGDPTYITSHGNAREKISSVDRQEIFEYIITKYLERDI